MQRNLRTIPVGVVLAAALAACGGGSGSSPAPQPVKQSANQVRHVRSIPCTPDSLGYCAVLLGRTHHGSGSCWSGVTVWEIYGPPDVDYGGYTYSWQQCPEFDAWWSPDEPAVEFSDGNLP